MAGSLADETFGKALSALEILAKVLPSLRFSECLQVCKVISREIDALVETERSLLAENHCLNYLGRLITVRTILDARGMTYDTKGINGLMTSLLSLVKSGLKKSAQKAVSSEFEISLHTIGSKRAASAMEESQTMAPGVNAPAAQTPPDTAVKKQVLPTQSIGGRPLLIRDDRSSSRRRSSPGPYQLNPILRVVNCTSL